MEAINKDELFDEELRGLVKFTDETVKHTQPVKAEKKNIQQRTSQRKENGTEAHMQANGCRIRACKDMV